MKTLIAIISTLLLIACSTGLNSNQDASSENIANQFLVNNSEATIKFDNLQLLKAK